MAHRGPLARVDVRDATFEDAWELGRITIDCRRATLHGLLPDELIERFTRKESARNWRRMLRDIDDGRVPGSALLVACVDGAIGGYAVTGPERTSDSEYPGEVRVLCVDGDHRGRGVGRMLVRHAAGRLEDAGLTPFLVRVLAASAAARGFYEALGGLLTDRARQIDEEGELLDEVAYGWRDNSLLR